MYLLEITMANGVAAKAIWDKTDPNDALMQKHQIMASAIANPNVSSALVLVLSEEGTVLDHEYWKRQEA